MRLWLFILNFPNRKVEEAIAHVRIVAKWLRGWWLIWLC
jgi:hypothetical protein